jgi:hypothetical protein
MTELCEVVITAPNPGWLKDLSRKLIEQRLCASTHNFAPVQSIYRWQGEIYERTEQRNGQVVDAPVILYGSDGRHHGRWSSSGCSFNVSAGLPDDRRNDRHSHSVLTGCPTEGARSQLPTCYG